MSLNLANALANVTQILSGIGVPPARLDQMGRHIPVGHSGALFQDLESLEVRSASSDRRAAKGDKGDTGPVTLDLSTSGMRGLTIGTGFAYEVGQNVRFAHDTTHYMEGPDYDRWPKRRGVLSVSDS